MTACKKSPQQLRFCFEPVISNSSNLLHQTDDADHDIHKNTTTTTNRRRQAEYYSQVDYNSKTENTSLILCASKSSPCLSISTPSRNYISSPPRSITPSPSKHLKCHSTNPSVHFLEDLSSYHQIDHHHHHHPLPMDSYPEYFYKENQNYSKTNSTATTQTSRRSRCLSTNSNYSNQSKIRGVSLNAPFDQVWNSCKIFVGGIGQGTVNSTLYKHFSQYGTILDCSVVTHRRTGRSRGFGFITFSTEEEAENALRNKHKVDDVLVEVRPALPRNEARETSPDDGQLMPNKIFIGGIPDHMKEIDCETYFAQFGKVLDVTLAYDKLNHRPRGFGFVIFENTESARSAIGCHMFDGKTIEAKAAIPRERHPTEDSIELFKRNENQQEILLLQQSIDRRNSLAQTNSTLSPNLTHNNNTFNNLSAVAINNHHSPIQSRNHQIEEINLTANSNNQQTLETLTPATPQSLQAIYPSSGSIQTPSQASNCSTLIFQGFSTPFYSSSLSCETNPSKFSGSSPNNFSWIPTSQESLSMAAGTHAIATVATTPLSAVTTAGSFPSSSQISSHPQNNGTPIFITQSATPLSSSSRCSTPSCSSSHQQVVPISSWAAAGGNPCILVVGGNENSQMLTNTPPPSSSSISSLSLSPSSQISSYIPSSMQHLSHMLSNSLPLTQQLIPLATDATWIPVNNSVATSGWLLSGTPHQLYAPVGFR